MGEFKSRLLPSNVTVPRGELSSDNPSFTENNCDTKRKYKLWLRYIFYVLSGPCECLRPPMSNSHPLECPQQRGFWKPDKYPQTELTVWPAPPQLNITPTQGATSISSSLNPGTFFKYGFQRPNTHGHRPQRRFESSNSPAPVNIFTKTMKL